MAGRVNTLAIEYAFYAFFALGLLCVIYVMASETFRHGNRLTMVARVERATRVVFVTAVLLTAVLAGTLYEPNAN